MTSTSTVSRAQGNPPSTAFDVGVPQMVADSSDRVPATVAAPKARPSKGKRLLRLALPYCLAAGVAGALIGTSGVALVIEGVESSRAYGESADSRRTRAKSLPEIQAAYGKLSFDEVRTMRRQIDAAKKAGIGFAIAPVPISEKIDNVRRHWRLDADEVAYTLAVHGRIYAGMLDSSRGYNRPLVEAPSAKAITSFTELQSYLAQFR
ncbi:MAG: hypothetical protein ACAI38_11275 [Myxococcota bacterium]|nr:hypothetical protein [Myxococcota bacterium]